MQRAIGLAAAARGANVIVDIGFGHSFSPVSVSALFEPDEFQNSQLCTRHCEELLRRSNPVLACGPWIASLRSQ
jgi:hypothetical protein